MSIETYDTDPWQGKAGQSGKDRTDLFVPLAMLLVSVAAGTGGHLHLGLAAEQAAAMALALFSILLVAHVMLRAARAEMDGEQKSARPASAFESGEGPSREGQSGGVAGRRILRSRAAKQGKQHTRVARPAAKGTDAATAAVVEAAAAEEAAKWSVGAAGDGARPVAGESGLAVTTPVSQAIARGEVAPTVVADTVLGHAPDGEVKRTAATMSGVEQQVGLNAIPPSDEAASLQAAIGWSFRPADQQLADDALDARRPSPDSGSLGALRPRILSASMPQVANSASEEESVRVNYILKRLADQIRGEAQPAASAPAARGGEDKSQQAVAAETVARETDRPDTSLAGAVNALRSTVAAMRSTSPQRGAGYGNGSGLPRTGIESAAQLSEWASKQAPAGADLGSAPHSVRTAAGTVAAADQRVVSELEVRLAAVAEAVAAERAEVWLEPILAIAEDQACHFEVSVRMMTATGDVLDARQVLEAARDAPRMRASGAGLLPMLDALGLRHSAGMALKLERRGRDGHVFSRVDGESLQNPRFAADVAGRHAQGIADRMVLTFTQDEVRGFGAAQYVALAETAGLGFRFALQGVSHLDMDFEALKAAGFEFVKLDADVFSNGLRLGGSTVPPSDLCRHFAGLGLSIIVGRIEDEAIRARILGFGVVFGQGTLFGGPRPIPVVSQARTVHAGR